MKKILSLLILTLIHYNLSAQLTITKIFTDLNGYTESINNSSTPIDNSAHLLAFKIGDSIYSTNVNNTLLDNNGISYIGQEWKAFEVSSITNNFDNNTFVGIGTNRSDSMVSPNRKLSDYITNGINGLDLGCGIYNIPNSRKIEYNVIEINDNAIDDYDYDIMITQIGDISPSANDKLYFVDENNNIIGNIVNINMSNIAPVGIVSNKFYNVTNSNQEVRTFAASVSSNPYRNLRIAVFKLSDFGITIQDIPNIKKYVHELSGTTDQCFTAYNKYSFTVSTSLPIQILNFSGYHNTYNYINFKTGKINNGKEIVLEYSNDGIEWKNINTFAIIDTDVENSYNYIHKEVSNKNLYRLKLVDLDNTIKYSYIIEINANIKSDIKLYPNPSKDFININKQVNVYHIYDISGKLLLSGKNTNVIDVRDLNSGTYIIDVDNIKMKFHKD